MLFRKSIAPCCAYCSRCRPIGREEAICLKRGIVKVSGACRRFRYDPLRRVPQKPAALPPVSHSEEEFIL